MVFVLSSFAGSSLKWSRHKSEFLPGWKWFDGIPADGSRGVKLRRAVGPSCRHCYVRADFWHVKPSFSRMSDVSNGHERHAAASLL